MSKQQTWLFAALLVVLVGFPALLLWVENPENERLLNWYLPAFQSLRFSAGELTIVQLSPTEMAGYIPSAFFIGLYAEGQAPMLLPKFLNMLAVAAVAVWILFRSRTSAVQAKQEHSAQKSFLGVLFLVGVLLATPGWVYAPGMLALSLWPVILLPLLAFIRQSNVRLSGVVVVMLIQPLVYPVWRLFFDQGNPPNNGSRNQQRLMNTLFLLLAGGHVLLYARAENLLLWQENFTQRGESLLLSLLSYQNPGILVAALFGAGYQFIVKPKQAWQGQGGLFLLLLPATFMAGWLAIPGWQLLISWAMAAFAAELLVTLARAGQQTTVFAILAGLLIHAGFQYAESWHPPTAGQPQTDAPGQELPRNLIQRLEQQPGTYLLGPAQSAPWLTAGALPTKAILFAQSTTTLSDTLPSGEIRLVSLARQKVNYLLTTNRVTVVYPALGDYLSAPLTQEAGWFLYKIEVPEKEIGAPGLAYAP